MKDILKLSVESEDSCCSLLEYAANNDVEGFRRSIELDLSAVDEPSLWYVRKKGPKQVVLEERTPLMVAASYGSVDVLKLLVALPEVDLNRACGQDKWTALHCAAFGGSVNAFDVIKTLLSAGADPNIEDDTGLIPVNVIVVQPKLPGARAALEDLLMNNTSDGSLSDSSPVSSSSPESRPTSEKKQYPIDPSLPDIRDSVFSTDEFRMFSFKVRPCSRAYSHDWTECPFVHPGENARRRDPRRYHYSCVPCPDFRKGSCRRGDMCEYAHGVFECWLHPAQYRTRLCKDGTSCARQVCFFAHTQAELRPLYVSTGSGVPSPRSSVSPSFVDMAAALSPFPGSPTSNVMSNSYSAWTQSSVPMLNLPGSNHQSSRLRASFSARDVPHEDTNFLYDFDRMVLNDNMACFPHSPHHRSKSPSNLEDLFTIASSPRYSNHGVCSPTHKFQEKPNVLSPIKTNAFSPRNIEHPFLQASVGVSSSPRSSIDHASPMSARFSAQSGQYMHNFSTRDIGSNLSPTASWGLSKVDWMRRSYPVEPNNYVHEPDLSWVQSLVKELPPEMPDSFHSGRCDIR